MTSLTAQSNFVYENLPIINMITWGSPKENLAGYAPDIKQPLLVYEHSTYEIWAKPHNEQCLFAVHMKMSHCCHSLSAREENSTVGIAKKSHWDKHEGGNDWYKSTDVDAMDIDKKNYRSNHGGWNERRISNTD